MPPKTKAKGKKVAKKSEGGTDEAVEEALTVDEQNLFLKRQVESLKHRLIMSSNTASHSNANSRELRNRLQVLRDDFRSEQQRTFDVTADMTRQYKAMKDELLQTINSLNAEIISFKDQLSEKETAMKEMEKHKDEIIAMKDSEIADWKQKMDEMAHEFSQMLKQTLDKMSERIIISNEDWDQEQGQDSQLRGKLEGFALGGSKQPGQS